MTTHFVDRERLVKFIICKQTDRQMLASKNIYSPIHSVDREKLVHNMQTNRQANVSQ